MPTLQEKAEALGHKMSFYRFQRGMTPIAPSRPVYGYELTCSCGWKRRVNGNRTVADVDANYHARDTIKNGAIQRAWDAYVELVDSEAERRFKADVLPLLKRRGWRFAGGMGTWVITDPNGNPEGHTSTEWHVDASQADHLDDAELQHVWKILSEGVPGLPSNDLGSLMPSWDGVELKGD